MSVARLSRRGLKWEIFAKPRGCLHGRLLPGDGGQERTVAIVKWDAVSRDLQPGRAFPVRFLPPNKTGEINTFGRETMSINTWASRMNLFHLEFYIFFNIAD